MKAKLKPCNGKDCNGALRHIWKQEGKNRYCQKCWNKILSGEKVVPVFKKQKPIPKESSKRKKEHVLYSVMRLQFLKDNPTCFMSIPEICTHKSTEIQHLKGRGKYYIDMTTWGAACHQCHSYATDHPEEAVNNGWAQLKLTEK